jgi:hypothetical protein
MPYGYPYPYGVPAPFPAYPGAYASGGGFWIALFIILFILLLIFGGWWWFTRFCWKIQACAIVHKLSLLVVSNDRIFQKINI